MHLLHRLIPISSVVLLVVTLLPHARLLATEAILLVPGEIQSGSRSSVTLTAFEGAEREPVDVTVSFYLVRDPTRVLLGETRTGSTGHITLNFDVPAVDPGIYDIEAVIEGITNPLMAESNVSRTPAILIETDKPIYKPSQVIQGRVLLLDNALRPSAGEVELSIHDAKGIRIDRRSLTTNEFGIAPFDLQLASEVNFGVWKIKASAGGVQSSRDVRVEHYVLPRYELAASFERSWYLVDEPISGSIDAQYFFGKPVAGTVEVVAKKYVGTWEVFAEVSGQLSDGVFDFGLPPVGFIAGTLGNNGLGTVTLEITATDSTGHTQSTTEILTVSEAPVVLNLISKASSMKPEMPVDILLTSEEPDGTPVDESVTVQADFFTFDGSLIGTDSSTVDIFGAANLSFTPPKDTSRAEITASAESDGHVANTSIEIASSWSPSSSYLSISRTGSQQAVAVGELLTFKSTSTHPGTVFFDVYAGGRTVFSGVGNKSQISFNATAEMAPKAKIVAYIINPDNEIAADTVPFDVQLPTTVLVSSTIDREELKPGDEITLTIDAGERAMVGLAIVDRSVLALGRSRLHLGEVFAELERRFMEPQSETHEHEEPGGPPGPFFDRGWFSPGAADIFEEVGLKMATTEGVNTPQGQDFRFWLDAAEDGPPVPAPNEGGDKGGSASPEDPVRVRSFFPETWVWNPTVLTDENGLATMNLTVPDSITSWSVSTVASTMYGIGFGQSEAVVFQEFFVEPNIPVAVTRGEEFPIRMQIYNYLEVSQTVDLQFGAGDWYELLGDASATIEVPAGSAMAVDFPIRPLLVGTHEVNVLARGTVLSDAVIREIRVEPEGEPVERVFNSVIEAGTTVPLDTSLPPFAVPDSGKAFLHITPSPIAQTLTGISGLLNMPFGCGEQNMIFLAPDVEILRYLQATGEIMPKIQAEAEYFINVGYQRELTFQTDDGGFAAFGGAEGSLWLTAFVLSTFSVARDVRDIDESVLARAADMLAGRQNPDGSFRTDDFLIHKEMDGGLSNIYSMAAYVTNALADYGNASISSPLIKAAQYLQSERTSVNDDAYALSIAAVALGKVSGFEDTTTSIVDRLLELAIDEGVGIHWEPYPIETTGYATLALLAQNRNSPASEAMDWLTTQRNSLGGYGQSTQDTVVAIRALTEAALKIRADLNVTLTVLDGEQQLATLIVDDSNYDILQSLELPVGRAEGLALSSVGSGSVGYQVATKYHVPGEELPPARDMSIEVIYDAEGIEVDDLVDVKVRIEYTGLKEKTGMTLVDIAVPTGFQAVRSTLDVLVEEEVASRIDVAGRKIIIYIDELTRDTQVAFQFQVKALFPVRAEAPISRVFEYYDPDVQATTKGSPLLVLEGSDDPVLFVRGDANDDDSVDISDPVRILGYLFDGGIELDCYDSADINDDGELNITDPIVLLNYLFLSGTAPKEPFPDAGEDTTEDGLDC